MKQLQRSNANSLTRALAFCAAAYLLIGFAGMMYGEWGSSVGVAGLITHLLSGVGFAVLGVGFGCGAATLALVRRAERRNAPMALIVFTIALALFALAGGTIQAANAAQDAFDGPRTDLCQLQDVDQSHASGRYSALRQDTATLTFLTSRGELVVLCVNATDLDNLGTYAEMTASPHVVTYFPASGVLVSMSTPA